LVCVKLPAVTLIKYIPLFHCEVSVLVLYSSNCFVKICFPNILYTSTFANETFLTTLKNIQSIIDEKTIYYKQRIMHELYTFLFALEEVFVYLHSKNIPISNTTIREFSNLIDIHLNKISTTEYADLLNVTPKKLTQYTKKQLGLTPLKYIHQRLLTEIKRDLTFKKLSHK